MKYTPPKFTDKELLEIFPESKSIITQKIKECKEAIKKRERETTALLKEIYAYKTDEFSEWFGEELIKMFLIPGIAKLEKNLFRLNNLKYLSDPNKQMDNHYKFKEQIEIAKRYPIEELARSKLELRQSGTNFSALCPFHNEKTPSFYIYTETQTFHCFGCQQHGDVIKLTMTLYGLNFKETVSMLQN